MNPTSAVFSKPALRKKWGNFRLALTKIHLALVVLFGISLLNGLVGLIGVRYVAGMLPAMVGENVSSVRAASQLEIAVLEQRGLVSSYFLDEGNPWWRDQLEAKRAAFRRWLAVAKASARTPEEANVLERIERTYQRYDQRRDEAIDLFNRGQAQQAAEIVLTEGPALYESTRLACEDLIDVNFDSMNQMIRQGERTARWLRWITLICLGSTFCLAAVLLATLFREVLSPLRHTAAEARRLAEVGEQTHNREASHDDLWWVRYSLQALADNAHRAQENLAVRQGELEQVQKLAAVGKLSAGVAHEVRSLLTTMKLWSYSLRDVVLDDGEVQSSFEMMHEELSRLEQLIRSFLDFARPPELNQQLHSVPHLVDQSLALVHPRISEKSLRVEWRFEKEVPPVLADGDQLKHVLLNLLTNACDASPSGGKLAVSAGVRRGEGAPPKVVVRVANQGPPIPAELQQKIFDPFFTTKQRGVGLGLSIAAGMAQRNGGEVVLESSNDEGTVFVLLLPPCQETDRGEGAAS